VTGTRALREFPVSYVVTRKILRLFNDAVSTAEVIEHR
jgi:hypothetical protein